VRRTELSRIKTPNYSRVRISFGRFAPMRVNAQKKAAQSPVSIVLQRDALPLTSKMGDGLPTLLYAGAYDLPVGDYDGVITVNDELLAQRPSSWLVRPLPEIRLPRTSNQNQSTDRRAPNGASAASTKSREWLLVSSQSALRSPRTCKLL